MLFLVFYDQTFLKKGIGQLRDFVNRNRNNLTVLDEKEWSVIIKKAFLECLETEIKAKANKSSGTLKSEFAVPCKEILTTLIEYSKSDNPEGKCFNFIINFDLMMNR